MTAQIAGLPILQPAPWMMGVAGLFGVIFGSVFVARRVPPREHGPALWDITRVAQMYTTVVGALAGFTAASAVFVARLGVDRAAEGFETTMGLFILAFLMLAAAAMEFANTPNAARTDEDFLRTQRLCFLIANVTLTQGICTGWLALRSLTLLIGLPGLSDTLGALLLIIVVLAAARLGQYLLDLTTACARICFATPLLSLGAAGVYAYGVCGAVPQLSPQGDAALEFAVVGTLVAALGFALQSATFTLHTHGYLRGRVADAIEHFIVGHTQVTAASFGLLAITVASA